MTFRGTFEEFDATLADGRLEGTAKVASIKVDDETLAGHLQSPDFFDAEQFPELRFVSHSIERDGERVSIAGELTIKGVGAAVELGRHGLRPGHRTATGTSGSGSTSRPRSTATTSASAGTPTCRAAARCSTTTSSSPPTSSWCKRSA